mmetsp:Transcript_151/g.367  ORF Transcript_151/g.367 Transcript_151/m.367 type:complete len:141 (-) Transcript_151:359-781(-)
MMKRIKRADEASPYHVCFIRSAIQRTVLCCALIRFIPIQSNSIQFSYEWNKIDATAQVRPAVSKGLGLKGSFKEGPWSFRICSLVVMTPIYATLLVCVGTVFGRHHYFRHFSVKMWSRFGIPPEMIDASYHQTKKTFRKW